MKGDQGKECDAQFAACEKREDACSENRTERAVKKNMMKALPEKCRVPEHASAEVNDDAKTIEIRRNTSQRDEACVTDVIGGFTRDDPTGEEMRYRRHAAVISITRFYAPIQTVYQPIQGDTNRYKPIVPTDWSCMNVTRGAWK